MTTATHPVLGPFHRAWKSSSFRLALCFSAVVVSILVGTLSVYYVEIVGTVSQRLDDYALRNSKRKATGQTLCLLNLKLKLTSAHQATLLNSARQVLSLRWHHLRLNGRGGLRWNGRWARMSKRGKPLQKPRTARPLAPARCSISTQ